MYGMVNGMQIDPNIHHSALQFDLTMSLPAVAFIVECRLIQSNREKEKTHEFLGGIKITSSI